MFMCKLKLATAVLLVVVLAGIGAGVLSTSAAEKAAPPVAADQKRGARVKWEYKAISPHAVENLAPKGSKDKLTEGLNILGDQGWELVAVQPGAVMSGFNGKIGSMPSTYLFKRAK
jgi:hypothetical protein